MFYSNLKTRQTTRRAKHLGLAYRINLCDLCCGKEEIKDNEAGQLKRRERCTEVQGSDYMGEGNGDSDFGGNKVTKQANLNRLKAGRAPQQHGSYPHANLPTQLYGLSVGVSRAPQVNCTATLA